MNLPPNEVEMKVSLADEADEVNNTEEDIVNDVVDKVISDEQPIAPKQLFEAQPPAKVKRKKKQLSEKQLAHLTRIRKLALEKRRQNRIAKTKEQPAIIKPSVASSVTSSVASSPTMSYDKFEEYMTIYKKRKKEAKGVSKQIEQDKEEDNSSLFFKTYTNPCELYGNLFY